MTTYSNTQDFRVKHGLVVTNTSSFGNSVSVSGNVSVTGNGVVSISTTNAQMVVLTTTGSVNVGNTLYVTKDIIASNGELSVTKANSSVSTSFSVKGDAVRVSGDIIVTGTANLVGNVSFNSNAYFSGSLYVGNNEVIDPAGNWVGAFEGIKGEKGNKGDTGSKGDKGQTVAVSNAAYYSGNNTIVFTNSDSSVAPLDATGLKGDKGEKGQQGEKGNKGEVGSTGSKGDKGDVGTKGDAGPTGATGSKGDTGSAGTKGDKGDTGSTGSSGAKGDKGDAGSKGDLSGISHLFYTDTTETVSVPPVSGLIFNSSSPSTTTRITLRNVDTQLANNEAFYNSIDALGNTSIKSILLIRNSANTAQTVNFTVSDVIAANQSYNKAFTVTYNSGNFSFANSTLLLLDFVPIGTTGVKGEKGDSSLFYLQEFTATAGQNTFNLGTPIANTSTATVYQNGVRLFSNNYSVNSTAIVLSSNAAANDEIAIAAYVDAIVGDKGQKGESSTYTFQEFTATAGQTLFTFTSPLSNVGVGSVSVFQNGVRLPSSEYTTNTTVLTLSTGAALNDDIAVSAYVDAIAGTKGEKGDTGSTGSKGDKGVSAASLYEQQFTSSESQTTYSPSFTLDSSVKVFKNGILLANTDYTTNSTAVVLSSGAANNDMVFLSILTGISYTRV